MIDSWALFTIDSVRVHGQYLDTVAPTLITTAQTLVPNDITRWQRPYPWYFDFLCVQWEEVETSRPSYIYYGSDMRVVSYFKKVYFLQFLLFLLGTF